MQAFCNTLTFIKLPFVIKIFVLSIFEWPFYCIKRLFNITDLGRVKTLTVFFPIRSLSAQLLGYGLVELHHTVNNLEKKHILRNRENLQHKKTADSVLLSLFVRTNGKCNFSA